MFPFFVRGGAKSFNLIGFSIPPRNRVSFFAYGVDFFAGVHCFTILTTRVTNESYFELEESKLCSGVRKYNSSISILNLSQSVRTDLSLNDAFRKRFFHY